MKIFLMACMGVIGLHASSALAAPTCHSVPYGAKCSRCIDWQQFPSYSIWQQTACQLNYNPTQAPGFPCNTASAIKKCGVIKKNIDAQSMPKESMRVPGVQMEPDQENGMK